MMSETQVTSLTEQQSLALKVFQGRCHKIEMRISLLGVSGILFFLLLGFTSAVKILGFTIFSAVLFYLLLILLVMRRQTGLWWHFLNDHPGWVVAPVALMVIAVWFVVTLDPAVRLSSGFPLSVFIPSFITLLSLIVQQWLRSWAQARAQVERARYGEHWNRLAQVSLRDMALFRIPHERA